MSAGHTEMKPCPKTIWLQPDCMTTPDYGRVWCEHDAPVNCDCPDGPHPWIKFDRAIEAAESDLLGRALAALREIRSANPMNINGAIESGTWAKIVAILSQEVK